MYLIKPKNHKGAIAIDPVDHRLVSFKLAGSGYYLDSILWYDFMVFHRDFFVVTHGNIIIFTFFKGSLGS